MEEKGKIKSDLFCSLKKLNAFWSYDAASLSKEVVNDELFIEKSLIHLDISDLKKLFLLFPHKKIRTDT